MFFYTILFVLSRLNRESFLCSLSLLDELTLSVVQHFSKAFQSLNFLDQNQIEFDVFLKALIIACPFLCTILVVCALFIYLIYDTNKYCQPVTYFSWGWLQCTVLITWFLSYPLWLYWLDMHMDMSVFSSFKDWWKVSLIFFEPNYCADIVTSLSFEALFYIGLATFLFVNRTSSKALSAT